VEIRKRRLELTLWAFLLSLSYYPGYLGFLAWFSLVRPLMIIARLQGRPAFNSAYFFGFFFNVFSLYWIAMVTPPGTLAAIAIVGFYYAAVLMLFNRLYHRKPVLGAIALPFLWVGMEYFRTLSQFAFPWSDLGYSQADYLYILQIVSVISVHGLSFLIVAVNVLLWQIFRKEVSAEKKLTSILVSIAVVALLTAYGWVVMPPHPVEGKFKVSILQGSVPLEEKWARANEGYSINLYDSLTRSVADSSVELFVWPETAVPTYLSHSASDRKRLGEIAITSGGYHLVGAMGASLKNGSRNYYNSCYQISPSGTTEKRYDKVKLVPFSEQVPYQDHLPFLRKEFLKKYLTFIETYDVQWWSDFHAGDSLVLFELPDTRYAVLICFESAFPNYARQAILEGADFVVGITNDTWFGHSVGIHMHSRIFLTRAVENRCWMVRAANSGYSYIVDKYGRIRGELQLDEVASLTGKIRMLDGFSVFTRIGDVVGLVSFLISLSIVVILLLSWFITRLFSVRQS